MWFKQKTRFPWENNGTIEWGKRRKGKSIHPEINRRVDSYQHVTVNEHGTFIAPDYLVKSNFFSRFRHSEHIQKETFHQMKFVLVIRNDIGWNSSFCGVCLCMFFSFVLIRKLTAKNETRRNFDIVSTSIFISLESFLFWTIKWDEPRIHRSFLSNAHVASHTFRSAFELFALIDHDNNVLLSSENIHSRLYEVSQLMTIIRLMQNERRFRDYTDQIREFFSRVILYWTHGFVGVFLYVFSGTFSVINE